MKIIKKFNFRVEVYPDSIYHYTATDKYIEESLLNKCKDIEKEIRRHIDFNSVNINYDIKTLCSHCNYLWEEDSKGMPYCCNAAQNEYCAANNIKLEEYKFE